VGAQGLQKLAGKASNRMSGTVGGKIAAAIKARQSDASDSRSKAGAENSLSASAMTVDAEAEVAAFRDRKGSAGEEES
jgi:hypothetical protein